MKLFVKGFDLHEAGIEIIARLNNRINFDKIFFLGNAKPPKEWIKPGTELHPVLDYDNVRYGAFEGVDWNTMEPIDSILIEEMADIERQVLNMLDREKPVYHKNLYFSTKERSNFKHDPHVRSYNINRYYTEQLSYHERRDFYLKSLRFWNNFINRTEIEIFLFPSVPHDSSEFVLYGLLQKKRKQTLMLHQSPFKNRVFVITNPFSFLFFSIAEPSDAPIECEFIKAELDRLNKSYEIQEIPYYEKKNNAIRKKEESKFKKIERIIKRLTLKNLQQIFNFDIDLYHYLFKGLASNAIFQKRLEHFYDQNSISPEYNESYIYVPLHFQPELTTAPLGGVFSNQLLLVQMLSFNLPENVFLYVKEHPQQKYKGRTINLYTDLLKIKNVRLIRKTENSFKLLENCIATATVTGTAGWEGLFKNKPFLMFGDYVYKEINGVFRIKNNDDCKEAMELILSGKVTIDHKELLDFAKAVERNTVYGFTQNPRDEMDLNRAINEMVERLAIHVLKAKVENSFD